MNPSLLALLNASFGFDATESQHDFVVDIPRNGEARTKNRRILAHWELPLHPPDMGYFCQNPL